MKCQIRTRRTVKVYMVVCVRARSLIHSLGRVFNTLLRCACMYLVCVWMYVFTSFDASTMHNSHAVTAPARYIFCLSFSPVFPVLRCVWCVLLMIHARTHTLKMHIQRNLWLQWREKTHHQLKSSTQSIQCVYVIAAIYSW